VLPLLHCLAPAADAAHALHQHELQHFPAACTHLHAHNQHSTRVLSLLHRCPLSSPCS
jgi:hypothetical protein